MTIKCHKGPVLIDCMVISIVVLLHSKAKFVKVVQNKLLLRKSLMLCCEDGSIFTTTMRALINRLKQLLFLNTQTKIWWVIRRLVRTWHEMISFHFYTWRTNIGVNVFRHLKEWLVQSECMFWRYFNQSSKSASTIACRSVEIFMRNI